MPNSEETGQIHVNELDCPTEQSRIARQLEASSGISSIAYDLKNRQISIAFDPLLISLENIRDSIENGCGYTCRIIESGGHESHVNSLTKRNTIVNEILLSRQGLVIYATFSLLLGMLLGVTGEKSAEVILYAISIIFSFVWIGPRVVLSVFNLRMDIFSLVSIAILGAMVLGLWDEAATVGVLFGVSELLETFAAQRARVSIDMLMKLQPDKAERIEADNSISVVDPSELNIGDMVRIRPGQKVPIDGVVHDGVTHIDQKVITGESLMVEAGTGSEVFAGTVNGDGLIQIEVIRQLKDSIVSQIARKVSQAQTKRAPIERIVDQFARFYTPAIVLIASLIVILPPLYFQFLNQPTNWQDWLFRGLVLLVIACPCALVISTPVAVVCALANSAKNGILVREGFVIEQFSQLQLIAFDKTGTLTQGRPQVQEIMKLSDKLTESDIIGMAAALGQAGSHVVSRSLVDYAEDNVINIPEANEVKEIPGLGTTGYINQQLVYLGSHRFIDKESLCSPAVHQIVVAAEKSSGTGVMIASKENAIAWIRLVDQPRKESAKMISDLKKMKIATMMLTGDNFNTAGEIAAMIGIEDYRAGLLPHEKSDLIEKLVQKEFKRVGMVGDGVNDAPSLVAATVGISMGDIASAITSQAADVVLINNNLNSISRLVRISKATNFIIHTNIILAIFSKFLVLILAVSGYANFLLAMLSDVGISIIVILNSLRLLKFEMKN